MKVGDLVKIKTGFSDIDGCLGFVISKAFDEYYYVLVSGWDMHFYRDEHVEVISEDR